MHEIWTANLLKKEDGIPDLKISGIEKGKKTPKNLTKESALCLLAIS
ncbi:hypothetical protein [Entomobacter blattae]|nr:hypothetical protein [Entomobacter blattae]